MKKNVLKLLLLSSLVLIPSCNSSTSEDKKEEEYKYEGTVIINEFENYDDMYKVRQLLQQISYAPEIVLDIEKENTKNGEGALSITYGNEVYGQIYQRLALSPNVKDCPVNDIASISIWAYNDNDFTAKVDLNIVGKETEILSTYTEVLEPKTWKQITYEINKVSLDAIYEDVKGFSFMFEKNPGGIYPAKFLVDDFAITFGAKNTEEDKEYLEKVNYIVEEIKKLPDIISVHDEVSINKCKVISKAYSELPVAYRPAVTNYDLFQVILQTYVDAVAENQAIDSDVIAYHFDTCFGLAQTSFTYTQTRFGISYSEDKHYKNEEGSLHLEFNNEKDWLSFQATSSVNMQEYEYIEFAVYNDSDADVGFCLTWDTLHIVEPGEWKTFIISTNYASFAPTFLIEFEFTSVDPSYYGDSEAHAFKGDVYLSQFRLHRKSADDFIAMLDNIPTNITADDEELISSIRYFYESLHKDEKSKVGKNYLAVLEAAERALLQAYYDTISDLVDSLPAVNGIEAYHGYKVTKAWKIYSSMTSDERTTYLTASQIDKLVVVHEAYTEAYEYLINSKSFTGENIGSAWDIRAIASSVVDPVYGDIASMELSNVSGANLGAFEFSFDKTDASMYEEVVFYVKAPHNDTFYLSRSAWRGGDNNQGYITSIAVLENTWTKISVPAKSFNEACFMEFYFGAEAQLGETYYVSSIYGVK